MIVLDASVLIAHLDTSDAHHERSTQMLADAADEPFAASSITVAEVLVAPVRRGALPAAAGALRALDVHEIPPGPGAAVRLALLRAETGLKLPDCCVLLAAEDCGATNVLTHDRQLQAAVARR